MEGAGDVPAVEQESRSFELPTEAAPADDAAPPANDGGTRSSSSSDDEEEKKPPVLPPSDKLPPDGSESSATAGGRWNQLLNHPYVTSTASTLRQRAGQAQERVQPLVNHPYVQKGMETGKKVYNREEGYEPKRLVPFFLATVGLVALGLLIRVLLQRYNPDFGALKMKFMKKGEH